MYLGIFCSVELPSFIFHWNHLHVTFTKLKTYYIKREKRHFEQTVCNYMNQSIGASCEFFSTVYFQGTMIHLLNYFHFYFQRSFKKAKLESLIPVGDRALFDWQRIQIRRWEIDSRRDSIWGVLNHIHFCNHLPVREIKVSRKSWKMKCLSTVLDSRSFPEPVTSRSVPMHVYINTPHLWCAVSNTEIVWCFGLLFWRWMWF